MLSQRVHEHAARSEDAGQSPIPSIPLAHLSLADRYSGSDALRKRRQMQVEYDS